jgi:hypothetical protein
MERAWEKIKKATTRDELLTGIIEELHVRAWQETAFMDRLAKSKTKRIAKEHAAAALECLAKHLTELTESAEVKA